MKQYGVKMKNAEVNVKTLGYFRWHEKFNKSDKLLGLMKYLDAEERELFNVDVKNLDQIRHGQIFEYGIGRYYMNLDLQSPTGDMQQILPLNQIALGEDLKFAMKTKMQPLNTNSFKATILSNQKFQSFLETVLVTDSNEK